MVWSCVCLWEHRWVFSHMLQLPRKFVQFLPPLLVTNRAASAPGPRRRPPHFPKQIRLAEALSGSGGEALSES
jgi:hypothetical protein